MAGLYLHIPFCRSRCIYCGFFSSTLQSSRGAYVDALCREMQLRADELTEPLETVYLGGGTPSQLSAVELRQLFLYINKVYGERFAHDMEITMECNPDDVTSDFCRTLSTLPVNRVSMGAQTFDDRRLAFLHRRHKAADVTTAVGRLRQAGIGNISVDLMFGFPEQTLEEWEADISAALSLDVEHLSAYSLMYEEGTPLHRLLEEGRVQEVDDELYRQMYGLLADRLSAAGYEHYEISNFARPGRRSRHNSAYWSGKPYVGLGAAAHSYDRKSRSWNVEDIDKYVACFSGDGPTVRTTEQIDNRTHYDDLIVTALRTREGITLSHLTKPEAEYLLSVAEKYLQAGLLHLTNGRLALTREGIFVSDSIMADLMWED